MVFASPFRVRDSGGTSLTLPCTCGSVSMTLLQSNKSSFLLPCPARLPFLNPPDQDADVLKVIDPGHTMNLSEEARRAMAVLSKAMNSARYIYDTNVSILKELYKTGAGRELANFVDFLLCDHPHGVGCRNDQKSPSHDAFKTNFKDKFCNLAETPIKHGGHGLVLYSSLQPFACRLRLQSPVEQKKVVNQGRRGRS